MSEGEECSVPADEVTNDVINESVEIRRRSKCRNVLSFLSVEPIVFRICLGFGIQMVISQVIKHPPASKAGREVANLTERKNPHMVSKNIVRLG